MSNRAKSRVSAWLVVCVLVLIALLIIWLTIANLWGDTDVAAWIAPQLSTLNLLQL